MLILVVCKIILFTHSEPFHEMFVLRGKCIVATALLLLPASVAEYFTDSDIKAAGT